MMSGPHPQEAALWKKLEAAREPAARCLALRELADHVGRYDLARSLALADQGIDVASLNNLVYEGALCRLERARSLRLLGEYAEAKATLEGLPPIFLDSGDRSSAGLAIKTKAATYLDLRVPERPAVGGSGAEVAVATDPATQATVSTEG